MIYRSLCCLIFLMTALFGADASVDVEEVAQIKVELETPRKTETFSPSSVTKTLETRVGEPFSPYVFDQDLKNLSENFDRIDPQVTHRDGRVYIVIKVWDKPMITSIRFYGNKQISSKKLKKELGVAPYTPFNRAEFNKGFNKMKQLYIKKGYFDSHLSYRIVPDYSANEVAIVVNIEEGSSGHIKRLEFEGFTKKEESHIMGLIQSKKYNFFISWITGRGYYHEEVLEHDKLVITNYLQNEGYADAHVSIDIDELPNGAIIIKIKADKGEVYRYDNVTFSGNTLIDNAEVEKHLLVKSGDIYSPEKLSKAVEELKHLYGQDGYIDTEVTYTLQLNGSKPEYDVHFKFVEGEQYKIGMIRVLGNSSTSKRVILRESLLVPGEVFDSRKLKATQERLEAIGYFKSVNVYDVKAPDDRSLGPNYRDVIIEVKETMTGNLSFFVGASSADSVFGGLELSESNFNYKGLFRLWKDGLSAVRGGGEYASAKINVGAKQKSFSVSWMTPYLNDSLWRLGFEGNLSKDELQTSDYYVKDMGGSVFASYPVTPFWTYGMKLRVANSIINMDQNKVDPEQVKQQERNSGLVFAYSNSMIYDSTDNPFKPHRGYRSVIEAEIAGMRRHSSNVRVFPFARFAYMNSYYYPIWALGTLKTVLNFKYLYPFANGHARYVALSERFFLGGNAELRGYKPFSIGPKFKNKDGEIDFGDPKGGVSSNYGSIEYLQEINRMLDVFAFFDAGSIVDKQFKFGKIRMSAGVGLRVDIGNRVPLVIGYGYPINPPIGKKGKREDVENFFFSMGGQF